MGCDPVLLQDAGFQPNVHSFTRRLKWRVTHADGDKINKPRVKLQAFVRPETLQPDVCIAPSGTNAALRCDCGKWSRMRNE